MRTLVDQPMTAPSIPERKKTRVVIWFASIGAVFLVYQLYIYGRWIASGPKRTPDGPTPIPDWFLITVRVLEVLSVLGFLVCAYYMVVKPLRRNGRLHWDSYLFFALLSMNWIDPWNNMHKIGIFYPTAFTQWGSWLNFLPFVTVPNAEAYPEPLLVTFTGYVWYDIGFLFGACLIMRKLKERWPERSLGQIMGMGFVWCVAVDAVLEVSFMMIGWYGYTGGISGLTLNAGKTYQNMIFEPIMWGAVMFCIAAVRFYRDDKGRSIIERGLDEMHVTRRVKSWMSVLALIALANLAYIAFYLMPFVVISDSWNLPASKPFADKSYRNAGFCGVGTDKACYSSNVPVPRFNSSIYIDLEGRPVYPPGNPLAPKN